MEKKPTPRQIGVHIKTLRGKRKQGEFARLVDVTQGAISAWERGDKRRVPSADIYFKLGSMARDPMETIFFWKLAGVNQEAIPRRCATSAIAGTSCTSKVREPGDSR